MKKLSLLFIYIILFSLSSVAEVDLKTGDFYIKHTDFDYSSLKGLTVDRTYNSASRTVGLFGYGWTSIYETRLYVIGDGNILIKEVGSGCQKCAENGSGNAGILIREKGFFELFFTPTEADQPKIDNAVGQIIQMLIRDKKIENSPVAIAKKRRELLASMSQRAAEWVTYTEKGWLAPVKPQANAKWFSTNGEMQHVVIKDSGFIRNYNDKSYESFDETGMMKNKYNEKGELVFAITYTANKISQITDGRGNEFKLQLNDKGLVTSIQVNNDKSTYQYNANSCLVKSVGADKKPKAYTYNTRNIMVGISEAEDNVLINFDPRTYRVTSVQNGLKDEVKKKEYKYQKLLKADGSVDPYRFAATVYKKDDEDDDGNKVDSVYTEYELREIMGRPYTYRTIVKKNEIETETIYTECGCGPLSIKRGSRYATFKYDGRSRMIGKENNEYIITAAYDDDLGKITRVERKDKSSGEIKISEFTYSPDGNVTEMKSKDMTIKLAYEQGHITKMESPDAVLLFKYNEIKKPIEIRMENGGLITVKYDAKGEIAKVESPDGHSMALKVTQAFQNLLALAKPEGLNYNLN